MRPWEDDAADELDPEGLHPQYAPGRLPHGGKGLGQDVVQRLPRGQAGLEFRRFGLEFRVREGGVLRLHGHDPVCNGFYFFKLPLAAGAENLGENAHSVLVPSFPSRLRELTYAS